MTDSVTIDPYSIQCAPGEEATPTEGGYVCVPADEAIPERTVEPGPPLEPPVAVYEVAFYVYPKLDPTVPAAWSNSGVQDLIVSVPGTDWFTSFPGELPAYVCGPGWGVQQDKVTHDGTFVWPESIEYPVDNIGWPPLYDAQHTDLEMYIEVPECVQATPTPTPVAGPPVLAATGGEGLLIAAIAAALLAVGFGCLAAASVARRPRYKRK